MFVKRISNLKSSFASINTKRFYATFDPRYHGKVLMKPGGLGTVNVSGLQNAVIGELVDFHHSSPDGPSINQGIALSLLKDHVTVGLFHNVAIREGDTASLTGKRLYVPVGDELLGRTIDPLGFPLDSQGEINTQNHIPSMSFQGTNILNIKSLSDPMFTQYMLVDSFIGLIKGETLLLEGKQGTGKTSLALDTIIAQSRLNKFRKNKLYSVYVAINQPNAVIQQSRDFLKEHGALESTVIVATDTESTNAMHFAAAYTGCAIGEFIQKNHGHSLVIYDSINNHAKSFCEMMNDKAHLNYLYSRLLGKSTHLSNNKGGGSLTSWAILEEEEEQMHQDLPFLRHQIVDQTLTFTREGIRKKMYPSIVYENPVSSKLGAETASQFRAIFAKEMAKELWDDIQKMEDPNSIENISQKIFNTEPEIQEQHQHSKIRASKVNALLKQQRLEFLSIEEQCLLLFFAKSEMLDEVKEVHLSGFLKGLIEYFRSVVKATEQEPSNPLFSKIVKQFTISAQEFFA